AEPTRGRLGGEREDLRHHRVEGRTLRARLPRRLAQLRAAGVEARAQPVVGHARKLFLEDARLRDHLARALQARRVTDADELLQLVPQRLDADVAKAQLEEAGSARP